MGIGRAAVAAATSAAAAGLALYLYRCYKRMKEPMAVREFKAFRLIERQEMGEATHLFVFQVPFGKELNLPAGKHVQICFTKSDGEQVLRSYTPTESSVPGRFDVLFKVYPGGQMGNYLNKLNVGDSAYIRGPTGRLSYKPGEFSVSGRKVICGHVLMLAGGTGITPMAQIVKAVLRNSGRDTTKLTLIVCSSTPEDVLLYHELVGFAEKHQTQFKLVYTVSKCTSEWDRRMARKGGAVVHETGRISKEMVLKYAPAFIRQRPFPTWAVAGYCGPPGFEKTAKGLLETLGYSLPSVNLFRW